MGTSSPVDGRGSPPRRRWPALVAGPGVLLAAVLAAYARTLRFGLLWDDYECCLRRLTWAEVARTFWSTWTPSGLEAAFYRPLAILSYALDDALWGGAFWPRHAEAIGLHGATSVLLFWLCSRLVRDRAAAFAAAAIFATSPWSVTVACWIADRPDALCGMLCAASLLAGVRAWQRGRGAWPAWVLFAAALMAKESAFIVPPALLLLTLNDRGHRAGWAGLLRVHGPLWAILGVYLAARWIMFPGLSGYQDEPGIVQELGRRVRYSALAAAGAGLPGTLFLPRWPFPYANFRFPGNPAPWHRVVAIVALAAAGAQTARLAWTRRHRLAWIGVALFCAFLVYVPVARHLKPRHMYFPSLLAAVGVAAMLADRRGKIRVAGWAIAAAVWVSSTTLGQAYVAALDPDGPLAFEKDALVYHQWYTPYLGAGQRAAVDAKMQRHQRRFGQELQAAWAETRRAPAAAAPWLRVGLVCEQLARCHRDREVLRYWGRALDAFRAFGDRAPEDPRSADAAARAERLSRWLRQAKSASPAAARADTPKPAMKSQGK